jgi:prepilin-type N-terminal cleavage/methylation domain-containing protein
MYRDHPSRPLSAPRAPRERRPHGYTLIELLVVLVLMGLAAALVLPALLPPRKNEPALEALIRSVRETAAQRGEVIYLQIEQTGQWRMEGGGSPLEGDLAHGRLPLASAPMTLIVSPLGSCALDVSSAAPASTPALDPLTCDLTVP